MALAAVDGRSPGAGRSVDALPDEQVAERLEMLFSLASRSSSPATSGRARDRRPRAALARARGQGLLRPRLRLLRGWIDGERGMLDAAQADEEEALESALLSGNVQVAYWGSIVLSRIALARGDVEAALDHGQRAWELLGTLEYSQAGFTMADARLAAGDPEAALAALETFGTVSRRCGRSTACRRRGRGAGPARAGAARRGGGRGRAPAEAAGRRTGVAAPSSPSPRPRCCWPGRADEAARRGRAGAAAGDEGDAAALGRPLPHARGRGAGRRAARADEARAELRLAAADARGPRRLRLPRRRAAGPAPPRRPTAGRAAGGAGARRRRSASPR